jgi:hypothetical protein
MFRLIRVIPVYPLYVKLKLNLVFSLRTLSLYKSNVRDRLWDFSESNTCTFDYFFRQ